MGMESKSGMVSASSKRSQGAIDCTVSDSELASGVEGGKEASWMCLLMEDLGITGPPILLLTDNKSLLDNVRTFKTSRKQRHVLGNIHFLRKETEEGRSVWGSIPGYGMYVDTLTKSLPTSKKARQIPLLLGESPEVIKFVQEVLASVALRFHLAAFSSVFL